MRMASRGVAPLEPPTPPEQTPRPKAFPPITLQDVGRLRLSERKCRRDGISEIIHPLNACRGLAERLAWSPTSEEWTRERLPAIGDGRAHGSPELV
jgi:hypothetical protein